MSQDFTSESMAWRPSRLFNRLNWLVFTLLTGLSTALAVAFFGVWFSLGRNISHPIVFILLTSIICARVVNSLARWFALPYMKRPHLVKAHRPLKVAVATTIVPGTESLEMLEVTVRALVALDYPHDTWVLDESDSERVKMICRRTGAHHFSRKNLQQYQCQNGPFQVDSKYGNYNSWLHEIGFDRYEILAAFDPDHVPIRAFLSNVLGYFEDPDVAYVQAPQAYYNQKASFIACGAAEETYEYYSCSLMAAYGVGVPAIVGCHNTHRMSALREVGGFPPHDADDMLLALRYRSRQWQGVYIPRILARGLTPVDWNSYLKQQLRWARSVVDIEVHLHRVLGKKPRFKERLLSALHLFCYVQNSVTTFAGILLLAFVLGTGQVFALGNDVWLTFIGLCAALQACALYRQHFYLDQTHERGWHARAALLRYAKWPVFIRALWDVTVGNRLPYTVTPKIKEESASYMLVVPHALIVILLLAASFVGLYRHQAIPLSVYVAAGAVLMTSLSLILTDRLRYPAPYDKSLLPLHPHRSTTLS